MFSATVSFCDFTSPLIDVNLHYRGDKSAVERDDQQSSHYTITHSVVDKAINSSDIRGRDCLYLRLVHIRVHFVFYSFL
jgi:hypothetical protein